MTFALARQRNDPTDLRSRMNLSGETSSMKELVAVLFGVLLGGVVGCFAGVLIGLIMTIAGYYAGLDGGWSIVLSTVALVICAVFGIFLGPFVLISLLSSQPHTKLKF